MRIDSGPRMARQVRSPRERGEVLRALAMAWERHPHLRLGQILIACAPGSNLSYVEDAELLRGLRADLVQHDVGEVLAGAAFLDEVCPRCGATRDEPCRTRQGRGDVTTPHRARMAAAGRKDAGVGSQPDHS